MSFQQGNVSQMGNSLQMEGATPLGSTSHRSQKCMPKERGRLDEFESEVELAYKL